MIEEDLAGIRHDLGDRIHHVDGVIGGREKPLGEVEHRRREKADPHQDAPDVVEVACVNIQGGEHERAADHQDALDHEDERQAEPGPRDAGSAAHRKEEDDSELERRGEHDRQHRAEHDELPRERDRVDQILPRHQAREPLGRPRGEEGPQHNTHQQVEAELPRRSPGLLAEEPVENREHGEGLQECPQEAEERSLVAELEGAERQLPGDEPVIVLCNGAWH